MHFAVSHNHEMVHYQRILGSDCFVHEVLLARHLAFADSLSFVVDPGETDYFDGVLIGVDIQPQE